MTARIRLALALAVSLWSATSAEAQSRDPAAAEALFVEGIALRNAGQWKEACEKFQASNELDPARGTLQNIGECLEKQGKLASAWAAYRRLYDEAEAAGDQPRLAAARERVRALTDQVPRLEISVEEGAAVPGLVVERDGEQILEAQLGVAVPLDPGTYALTARAPGHEGWSVEITLTAGGQERVVVPRLPRVHAKKRSAARRGHRSDRWRLSPRRKLALGVAGASLVGVVVGTVYGLKANSRWQDAQDYCDDGVCFDQRGIDLGNQADRAANVANVAFAVGLGAAAAAVVLWLTAPADARADTMAGLRFTPVIGASGVGASFRF